MSTTLITSYAPTPSTCPQCGSSMAHAAHGDDDDGTTVATQERIRELESQVKILTGKATAAVDKLADYEDQIHRLRSTQPAPPPVPVPTPATPTIPTRLSTLLSPRLGSPSRSPQPAAVAAKSAPPTQSETEALLSLLTHEQNLRVAAETSLAATNTELEDLSVQLFTQANEMVAQERKARAKLEARVEVLERRDNEKRVRLERLETAIKRVERVRGLLNGADS